MLLVRNYIRVREMKRADNEIYDKIIDMIERERKQ